MSLALDPATYKKELIEAQGEFGLLSRRLRKRKRSLILVFEGPDAAGKGGTIRRLTAAMDARLPGPVGGGADGRGAGSSLPLAVLASPAAVGSGDDLRPLVVRPGAGRARRGFLPRPDQWRRAYEEINAFEEQLIEFGLILAKFWLAITPEEQLRRFEARQTTPHKQYKLTAEDWRNRDRWSAYEAAACEMIERTGTESSPWMLVEGNNKEWARVKVLKEVVRHVRSALK